MDAASGFSAGRENAQVAEQALEALRLDWGGAYRIGCDDGGWWYERRDGRGGRQEAASPDDVARMIADDHAFMPVRVPGADEDEAVAELELAWSCVGYHGFSADGGLWSAISSAGDVLTGESPGALSGTIRAHWQARQ